MTTAVTILLLLLAADLLCCSLLLLFVWHQHYRMRRQAAVEGNALPAAHAEIGGCLLVCLLGLVVLGILIWLLQEPAHTTVLTTGVIKGWG
ncbi:MAG: hypothetical protein RMJ88_16240 [Thermogemmata sp.]|nr:hypothetical protein [Thermogemmata sp.]